MSIRGAGKSLFIVAPLQAHAAPQKKGTENMRNIKKHEKAKLYGIIYSFISFLFLCTMCCALKGEEKDPIGYERHTKKGAKEQKEAT